MRLGIDLGGTKIEAAALADDGALIERRRRPTPQGDYTATLATVKQLVDELAVELKVPADTGVGVATPGSLSPLSGLIRNANSTCLNGMPLDRDLQALLRRPVRIANDADCFTLSEAVDGSGQDARSVFGVILGTGTGGGIVIGKQVLRGPNAISGEWGHNPLPWPQDDERPGPPCYCGKHGCIETYLSGPGLSRDYESRTGARLTPAQISAGAAAGNAAAEQSLCAYEDRLARALATVANVLDPEVIILGGGLSNLQRLYSRVPRLMGQFLFSDCMHTRLLPPRHGDSSGVRGAAWLFDA